MRNFQDTYERRKQSIYQYFFNLHDRNFNAENRRLEMVLEGNKYIYTSS